MTLRRRQIEEIYRRRYLRFRNALATITGSYDSARDVVQEAFVQALRHRRSFRGDAPPEAWVWSIALRIALRERARGDFAPLETVDEIETALVEPERDPALADALQKLPPRRRLMIFLRYYADLSYEEIASLCGVSPGTVAATLAQSHDTLRASLTQQGALR